MYSADQYSRAKAQLAGAPPEAKAILRQRIQEYHEYEVATPQRAALKEGVDETMPEERPSVPALPADRSNALGVPADFIDTTHDDNIPNASKLKTLAVAPEYVSKNPLAGIAHVAKATLMDPLDGPGVGMYSEPSEKQFESDMGRVLKARGIVRGQVEPGGRNHYQEAYDEYKDRQWKKAYDQAAATDTPLTRVEYAGDSKSGWTQLERLLAQSPDVMSAFAKGYASGATNGATKVLGAASDSMTGGDEALRDREQAERDPIASTAGEVLGAINPRSIASKVTGAVSRGATGLAERYLPGAASRIVGSSVGALAGGETGLAGRAAAQGAADQAHGWGTESAKDTFTKNLLGTGLISAGLGGFGQSLAEGAGVFQKGTAKAYPELGPFREGGGNTDLLRGVKPPPDVVANEEAARFPIPGETKARPTGTPEEVAASKLQEPLTAQNASDMKEAVARAERENAQALATNTELQKPKPMRATANALLDEVLGRVDPSKAGTGEFLPAEGSDLAYSNNRAHIEAVKKLWKPQVVLAMEAPDVARANGGRVITIQEAERLKYPLNFSAPDTEGVPVDAPPIPDDAGFERAAQNADAAAKDSGQHATVLDFLNRSRAAEAAAERDGVERAASQGVSKFLADAAARGATYDGAVYRGTTPAELETLLGDAGQTRATWSVSKDMEGALPFARKGGVLLKIEGAPAVPVDGIEGSNTFGEALIPKNQRFEVASDKTANGVRTVTLRPAAADTGATTAQDVFGRAAEKPAPYAGQELGPREGRAARTPAPETGSDWDTRDRRAARFEHARGERPPLPGEVYVPTPNDNPTRVSNSPPLGAAPPTPSAPSGPPPELLPSSPAATQARAANIPSREFKVVMTPVDMDAQTLENQLKVVDRAAKAGTEAQVDPIYNRLQKEIRTDREQFGKDWADLKERHHDVFTQLEQRAGAANLAGDDPYSKMTAQQRKAFNETLLAYGSGRPDATEALRSLARDAGKGPELDTLGAQNAYTQLKGRAQPRLGEAVGPSLNVSAHLRGLGPAARLRSDALARGISRGASDAERYIPGMSLLSMGEGGMGLKTGSVYDATRDRGRLKPRLSESERADLQRLLDATQGAK